jgi:hypothetical protein
MNIDKLLNNVIMLGSEDTAHIWNKMHTWSNTFSVCKKMRQQEGQKGNVLGSDVLEGPYI